MHSGASDEKIINDSEYKIRALHIEKQIKKKCDEMNSIYLQARQLPEPEKKLKELFKVQEDICEQEARLKYEQGLFEQRKAASDGEYAHQKADLERQKADLVALGHKVKQGHKALEADRKKANEDLARDQDCLRQERKALYAIVQQVSDVLKVAYGTAHDSLQGILGSLRMHDPTLLRPPATIK